MTAAVLFAALAAAAPAGAADRIPIQSAAFDVRLSPPPPRDVVIEKQSKAQARAVGEATLGRYPVGGGQSVDITQSVLCPTMCDDTPEEIAALLGTFPHGDEMNLLSVHMVTQGEMSSPTNCGAGALACYYPAQNRMVISGDDFTNPSDGATQEFVIAHEYGHHLANHRSNPPFDDPALDWGPKRWASYVRVCQGVAEGRYFPGAYGGTTYYQNPGEAFAESYGFAVYPSLGVVWNWTPFPKPEPNMYAQIQADALSPWVAPTTDKRKGRFAKRKRPKRKVKLFATPLDGNLTLKLNGTTRSDMALILRGPDGVELERSDGLTSKESVSYLICGEGSFSASVRRRGRFRTRFTLNGQIP